MTGLRHVWIPTAMALAALGFPASTFGQDVPAPAPREPYGVHAGARLSLWLGNFEFEARTAAGEVTLDESVVPAAELYGVLDLDETWSVELGLEALLTTHANAFNVALSARYKLDLLGDAWTTYAKAGVLAGTVDLDDAPGDFEPGFGVQGGLGADYALSPSLSLNLELKLRYLEYEFDEDPNFLKIDGSIGGFGVGVSAGIDLRF